MTRRRTLLFVVTEDWYFVSHRLALAREAVRAGYRVYVATRVQDHADEIRAAGCEIIPLPWRRRGGPPCSELRTFGRLLRIYRALRPDIVHHVALKPIVYGSLIAWLTGVRGVVNALAGLGYVFASDDLRARLLRPALRLALLAAFKSTRSYVIVQNPEDRDVLLESRLVRADRLVLIKGSGVDLHAFAATPPTAGTCTVLLVARMLWHKGVGDFVNAARLLRASGIGARFVLVGDADRGNPAAVDAIQLSEWHASGVVEWWGHRTDMPSILSQAHIVCLPSYYREGVPMALIEAAAVGRPIVASDMPGCREIVRHDENGLLVPPRNIEALAAGLRRLIEDPALRTRMGARGRQIAETGFSVERVVAETLELYQRVSGHPSSGSSSAA